MDQVRALVVSGRWPLDTMLPSVRQMATELEINMMTVSKAYAKLEAEGVVERVRGTGMRVTGKSVEGTLAQRKANFVPSVKVLLTQGQQLGLTPTQIVSVVQEVLRDSQPKSKA